MFVKRWILSLWTIIDPIYYALTRLKYIKDGDNNNIFRVRMMTYRGKDVRLTNGEMLRKGDKMLRIHLHNIKLLKQLRKIDNELLKARLVYRTVQQSLPGLYKYIENHPKKEQIQGILGITLLNRGCRSLGFDPIPLSNKLFIAYKWLTFLPIHFLSVNQPIKSLKKHQPVYLYMSKQMLTQRYRSQALPRRVQSRSVQMQKSAQA